MTEKKKNHKDVERNEPSKENKKPKDLQEIENPYTVTNRVVDELVDPKNTMFFLTDKQINLILRAYEIALLPTYFGEPPVTEMMDYANNLKYYLLSKQGRGRKDILRVLRVSSGQVRENVNKSLFRQMLHGGSDDEEDRE